MIQIPTPVFILFIGIVLYILFRDDAKRKPPLKKYTTFKPVDSEEFYEALKEKEAVQIPELN